MDTSVRLRLGAMMFLQFFIWGGWFVTMGTFLANTLGASGAQIGLAYATQSWGAIIAPFVVGLMADRWFNAERLLAALHLIGAVLLYALSQAGRFDAFYPLVFGYMLVYMPTLALVNTIAFRQLSDPSRKFAAIRVWGTGGWIAAGLVISLVFAWDAAPAVTAGQLRNTFLMCAAASALLGLMSFTLPATPPVHTAARERLGDRLGLGALQLLRDRNFLAFFVASVLICIPLAFYYQHANQFLVEVGVTNATGKQTLGQFSEVLFMLLIPVFLRRFGMKFTLLVGMAAWAVRYVLFAFGDPSGTATMLLIGIALHGVCYDFFFVSGQIYTDAKAGASHRSAAQGLITLATYGVGMLIGFWAAGHVTDAYMTAGKLHDWQSIWLYPAGFAALVGLAFALVFRNERVTYDVAPAIGPECPSDARGA